MKERIRAIMESKGMTQQEFSQFLEMSPASLSSIFTGRTNPTLNVVESIKKKFEKINLEWLMFGSGTMFLDDDGSQTEIEETCVIVPDSDNYGTQDAGAENTEVMSQSRNIVDNGRSSSIRDNLRSTSQSRQPASFNDMKIFNNNIRKIKEIRVFYDDQTYESFVPKEPSR